MSAHAILPRSPCYRIKAGSPVLTQRVSWPLAAPQQSIDAWCSGFLALQSQLRNWEPQICSIRSLPGRARHEASRGLPTGRPRTTWRKSAPFSCTAAPHAAQHVQEQAERHGLGLQLEITREIALRVLCPSCRVSCIPRCTDGGATVIITERASMAASVAAPALGSVM